VFAISNVLVFQYMVNVLTNVLV